MSAVIAIIFIYLYIPYISSTYGQRVIHFKVSHFYFTSDTDGSQKTPVAPGLHKKKQKSFTVHLSMSEI